MNVSNAPKEVSTPETTTTTVLNWLGFGNKSSKQTGGSGPTLPRPRSRTRERPPARASGRGVVAHPPRQPHGVDLHGVLANSPRIPNLM